MQFYSYLILTLSFCILQEQLWSQTLNLGADVQVCASTYTLDAGANGVSYLWNTGATTRQLVVSSSGNYSVSVDYGNGMQTDDINVSLNTPISLSARNLQLCMGANTIAAAASMLPATKYFWYSSATATSPIHHGFNHMITVTGSSDYWVRALQLQDSFTIGYTTPTIATTTLLPIASIGNDRKGIVLEATEPLLLSSVEIPVEDAPMTADLQILDASNAVVYTQPITLNVGNNIVDINYLLGIGTGYKMVLSTVRGAGKLYQTGQTSPPYRVANNGMLIRSGFFSGIVTNNYHFYFFNLKFSKNYCKSDAVQIHVDALPSPIVPLNNSYLSCTGNLVLDATLPNSTYQWSTGETTSSITVTTSGQASVTVTTSGCSSAKTVNYIVEPQITVQRPDTLVCKGEHTFPIINPQTGVRYSWFKDQNTILPLQVQNAFSANIVSDTNFYVQGFRLIDSFSAALASYVLTDSSRFVPADSIRDMRGVVFTVLEPLNLVSVDVAVQQGYVNATFQIRSAANVVLYERQVNLLEGNNTIALGYEIPVAVGYRMFLVNLSGTGKLYQGRYPDIRYPMESNGIRLTSGYYGQISNNYYNYFYNFKISKQYCTTPKQRFNVALKPDPIINLDSVITACQYNIVLNVENPNATYLWSTGATTSSVTLNSAQSISVTVNRDGCSKTVNSRVLLGAPIVINRPDTSFCRGEYTMSLLTPTSDATYLWYNTNNAIVPFQKGLTVSDYYATAKDYFIQGFRGLDSVAVGYTSLVPSGLGFVNINASTDVRGIVFDMQRTAQIYSVEIPVQDGELLGKLQIRNSANTVLFTKDIHLVAGSNVVDINYTLLPAIGYRLVLTNMTGAGKVHMGGTTSRDYPRLEHGVNFTSSFYSGSITTQYHCCFYNLKVSKNECFTPRENFHVEVLPTPLGVLPNESLHCGVTNYTLDAANTGATYQWSTGETTQTINVTQSGLYTVEMFMGQCNDIDSVQVYLLDTVQAFQAPTPTFCAGEQTISVSGPSTTNYLWMSAPTGGSIIGIGQQLTRNFTASQTLYVEAQNTLFNTYAGLSDNTLINATNSGYVNITDNNRGFLFTANQSAILKTVKVYVDGYLEATVQLRTRAGVILENKNVVLTTGTQVLDLNFSIPSAGEYILALTNVSGSGRLFSDLPDGTTIYPLTSSLIDITNAVVNGSVVTSGGNRQLYSYFYDWNVVKLACPTSRRISEITVLPTPIIALPSDTVFCANTATVSAANTANTGAIYAWSTGETTANLITNTSGSYSVTATMGSCEKSHTIGISIANPPTQIIPGNDTTICGGQLALTAQGNGFAQVWYNSATSSAPIGVGDTFTTYYDRDSTIWVESVNFVNRVNPIGLISPTLGTGSYLNSTNLSVEAGLDFDVIMPIRLDQVSLYVSEMATDAKVILYDMYGLELQSQWIHLPIIGENIVNLNWILLPASGYQIVLDSITGGKIYTQNATFPFLNNELRIQRGVPSTTSSRYAFFYKWKISNLACATPRMPIQVTVPPYPVVNMPATLTACNTSNSINIPIQTAANTNYTYAWSSGQTTNNIDVTQSGYYQVTVSNNGICNIVRDVYVQFLQSPSNVQVQDLNFCASGEVELLQSSANEIYQFYTNDGNQTFLYLDAPYTTFVQADTSFIIGAAARATARVGLQSAMNANDLNNYAAYNIPNTFDVNAWVVFDSVAIYAQTAPATFDIVIKNNSNTEVYRKTVTITRANQKVFIPINKTLAPGSDYQLQFANFNTAFLVDYSAYYPMQTTNAEVVLSGTNLSGITYPCFFDWHFSYGDINCIAPNTDILDISIKFPAILPDTPVFVCSQYITDVANSAATGYLWNTGETTSYVSFENEGLYIVTITDGNACLVVDSVLVQKPEPLTLTSGVNCGDTLHANYTSLVNTTYSWDNGSLLPYIVLDGHTGNYALTVTTPQGCLLTASTTITAIDEVPYFNLGTSRVICEGHYLEMPSIGTGYTYFWNTGETTDYATIGASGLYEVTVTSPLGCTRSADVIINSMLPPVAGLSLFYNQSREVGISNLSTNYNYHFYDYGDGSPYTTASFHTYDIDSCYTISVIAYNACGADTAAIDIAVGNVDCTVGVEENLQQDNAINFVILPNPNYGQFAMQWNTLTKAESAIIIYDITGRVLYKEFLTMGIEHWQLNMPQELAAGVYFVQWQSGNHKQVERMVIVR